MRYVGRDDSNIYMRCGHCKKVSVYAASAVEDGKIHECSLCKKPFRFILFHPGKFSAVVLKRWLPPLLMAVFMLAFIALLSSPLLLKQYRFNLIVNTSNAFFSSILITVLGAVLGDVSSVLLSKSATGQSDAVSKNKIPMLVVIGEVILFAFVVKPILVAHYSPLEIENSDINESQQYFGAVVDGRACGKGRLFDHQGNLIYDGEFDNNLYNGHGREYRYDAQYKFKKAKTENPSLYYEGEFLNGKYCGYGTLYNIHSKYQGCFFEGKLNGYAAYWEEVDSKVYRYNACFRDGKLNGAGIKYYPNGKKLYEGEYQNGSGVDGKIYWKNGNLKYDGKLKNNMNEGNGISYREDGTKEYEGGWKENKHSGYGVEYFEDGKTIYYEGRWDSGKRNGNGKKYYSNGILLFSGTWSEGLPDGKGQWYWENGELYYEGDYDKGQRTGYGTTYSDVGVMEYRGNFENGKRSGEGVSYWSNGKVEYEGEWVDGERSGQGKAFSEDGELLYEGQFKNGEFVG